MSSVEAIIQANSQPLLQTTGNSPQPISNHYQIRNTRLHYFGKLVQTTLFTPVTTTMALAFRGIKHLTWVPVKTGVYQASGYHKDSASFFHKEYLLTLKTIRDLFSIPSIIKRVFKDLVAKREHFIDDIKPMAPHDYLKVEYNKSIQQFSSQIHGCRTCDVIAPIGISEHAAASDAALKTVMASHLFKPGILAINFGVPNVASFITEKGENDTVQTFKVDAKSLKREPMAFHATNGKIQSGVFLVPTNLPEEALERFKQAAEAMVGRKDITCVNTNCRVLKEAGFSIEAIDLDKVVFPNTLIEHFLFRNVFYTDTNGVKRKVHFDIIKTATSNLEEYFQEVDTAVVNTHQRHRLRNADTEENQRARGAAAKALIEEEARRLSEAGPAPEVTDDGLGHRKVSVSVPSYLADSIARIWGRHTIYELDLSDKKEEIAEAFENIARTREDQAVKLKPFPQEKPSLSTRLKRDFFFSGPMIRFLRRHMMGHVDELHLHTQDLFKHLKSTNGERLNYVVLDDKIVLAKVHANGDRQDKHRKAADWALSKHGLLASREEVYVSGEMWYDKNTNRFKMNCDSGTYMPNFERVKVAVDLANRFFNAGLYDNVFEAVEVNQEVA